MIFLDIKRYLFLVGFFWICGITFCAEEVIPKPEDAAAENETKPEGETQGETSIPVPEVTIDYAQKAATAQVTLDALPENVPDEAIRERAARQWRQAIDLWKKAQDTSAQIKVLRERAEGAKTRQDTIAESLKKIQTDSEAFNSKKDSSDDIKTLETDINTLRADIADWQKRLDGYIAAAEDSSTQVRTAQTAAQAAKERLNAPPPVEEGIPQQIKEASDSARDAQRAADRETIAFGDTLSAFQPAFSALNQAERDLLSAQLAFARRKQAVWDEKLTRLREAAAAQLGAETRSTSLEEIPNLPENIKEAVEYAKTLVSALDRELAKERDNTAQLRMTEESLSKLKAEYDQRKTQLESGGGSALGPHLWKRRLELRRDSYIAQRQLIYGEETPIDEEEIVDIEELRRNKHSLEQSFAKFKNSLNPEHLETVSAAITRYEQLVDNLSGARRRNAVLTTDLADKTHELRQWTLQFVALVEKHILRLASCPPVWRLSFSSALKAISETFTLEVWEGSAFGFAEGLRSRPYLAILTLIGLALFWIKIRFRWNPADPFLPRPETRKGLLKRAGFAVFHAIPDALLFYAFGTALWVGAEPASGPAALGTALRETSALRLLFSFCFAACAPKNIVESYLRITEETAKRLRRHFQFLTLIGLTLWFSAWFAVGRLDLPHFQGLAGFLSCILALFFSIYWGIYWRPSVLWIESPENATDAAYQEKKMYFFRLWTIVYVIGIVLASAWVFAAILGYVHATFLSIEKIVQTLFLRIIAALVCKYWEFHLNRNRERLRAQALIAHRTIIRDEKRRADEKAKAEKEGTTISNVTVTTTSAIPIPTLPQDVVADVNLPQIVEGELTESLENGKRFIRWLIAVATLFTGIILWSSIVSLPTYLSSITLWNHSKDESVVTVWSVFIALIVGWWAYILSGTIGGFLHLTFFGWHPAERGSRVSTGALFRYGILMLAALWIASRLGIAWGDMQWLVAAMGVGLGFGMQDIIVNFVSGIILLFERPVRVGDAVTIGTAEGTITQIHIRTTTLLDWDHRELIIPNKELVTARIINWSLSDAVTRIIVTVSLPFGTDLDIAQKLLLKAAEEDPLVLQNPSPTVFLGPLSGAGQTFELRAHAARLEDRVPAQHSLQLAINRLMKSHGITLSATTSSTRLGEP